MRKIANFAGFQAVWFACVLMPSLGLAVFGVVDNLSADLPFMEDLVKDVSPRLALLDAAETVVWVGFPQRFQ